MPAGCLLAEDFFEQIEGARILALAQPEEGCLSELRVRVGASNPDECWNAFVGRALAEGKYRLFAEFPAGVVVGHH